MFRSLIAALVFAAPAHAASWVCYAQTGIATNASIVNPMPSHNGLYGECPGLPYVVPAGHYLVIRSYGVEGYAGWSGGVVIAPGIGPDATANGGYLPSVQAGAGAGSKQLAGLNFALPPGKSLHVLLQNTQPAGVFGWFVSGELLPLSGVAP